MSQTKPLTATRTYWVQATNATPTGPMHYRVAFGPERSPLCWLIPVGEAAPNFSSREHAEALAEHAATHLQPPDDWACPLTTEVIEED